MFGPRLTRIFASRWNALWWAAGILLLAWQIVPSPDEDETPDAAASAPATTASNPWALSPTDQGRS